MGSLIWRATCPKSPEYRSLAWVSRRFLITHNRPMQPSAPMTIPGKKPAAKEPPLKLESGCTGTAAQPDVCEAVAGRVAEGEGRADVGDADGDAESLKHMPLLQL
jgi:hypothetical protein